MIASDRRWRRRGAAALAAVAVAGLAACGDDKQETVATPAAASVAAVAKRTPTVKLVADARGKDKLTLQAPAKVAAGLVTLTLENSDSRPREAQLVRVAGKQTLEQVLRVRELENGSATPAWFTVSGGVATTPPGRTASVTQTLAPGIYYAIDGQKDGPPGDPRIPSHARLGATARFLVTGAGAGSGGKLPSVPATISAEEHVFTITGLKAGRNRVRFKNAGTEPHHAVLFPLLEGSTIADAKRYLATERPTGRPPVDFAGTRMTTALAGGTAQVAELDLRAGRYAVVCFLTDRKGGKPHIAKGQIAEVTVR